jgi:hypothetical protein
MKMGQYLNLRVLVSMPALFQDGPLTCTLIGVEPSGLWLESEDLFERFQLHPQQHSVFIPFTQIAFVTEPSPKEHATHHEKSEAHQPKTRKRR